MADIITTEQLQNASLDAKALEKAINGADTEDVLTRLNLTYPTLAKAIKTIMSKAPINSTPFATKSALLADTTLANGAFAFVYNDVIDNNGIYYKANSVWTKASYDILQQSYIKKAAGFTTIANIADLSKVDSNKYVEYVSGIYYPSGSTSVLGRYAIEPNTLYRVPNDYQQQFAFFDINGNYISGMAAANADHTFTTPSNAAFISLTVPNTQINKFMLAKASEYPSTYTPFKVLLPSLTIETKQVDNLLGYVKDELGFYTINIVDTTGYTPDKYIGYGSGLLYNSTSTLVTKPLVVKPSTLYRVSDEYVQQFAFFDANNNFISGMAAANADHTFTTPSNAAFVRFTIPNTQLSRLVVAEASVFPSTYMPFGSKIKNLITDKVTTTEIVVSADLNDTDTLVKFKGKNAIQQAIDSITDASATNRYKVITKAGLYKITQANEFIGNRGYPAMVCPKDYVDIVGQGENNTIVWAELPADDAQVGLSVDGQQLDRSRYQTIYNYAGNSTISDITFVAVNLRYTLHQDAVEAANKSRNYKNVSMIFRGSKGVLKPFGCGTFNGDETYYEGGTSLGDEFIAFSTHNNTAFTKPSAWYFKGHNFSAIAGRTAVQLQNDGSLVQDKFEMIGCTFSGTGYILNYMDNWLDGTTSKNYDSFNHAEWQVTGYGNEPFLFENTLKDGISLRIKSNTTGASSTVRFDTSSSAYPILIKNNHNYAPLYTNKYDYVDNYIVQDGSVGLSGQAIGCLDVSETVYAYNAGTNYTSLAKRLGNLSSSAKTLVVIVNSVTNTVTFNKDYSNMSNAQILADINAQLSNATADFYNYGRDYYPLMTDVSECVYNLTTSFIPKGAIVTKIGGLVRIANANDKIFGVALDDIPVMRTANGYKKGQGRVLKRGYISANRANAHFVLADNQSPVLGTRFAVSNGQLVTNASGKIGVDIDAGVVSINC